MKKFLWFHDLFLIIIGAFILAFGIYEIHSLSGVTEGGVLGLALLFEHHFDLSPAISSLIMNIICYGFGLKILGKKFLISSAIATPVFSLSYRLLELTPPIFPEIYNYPLVACIIGAIFVGVGAGLCVKAGGAPTGDDALAMGFSSLLKVKIERIYLLSDLTVLLLSLTYIPLKRIVFSVITVILSGKIIGIINKK